MKLPFRKLKLKSRMMFILGLMALLQTSMLGLFALQYLNQSLNDEIGVRALHVAKTIAAMPEVANAVKRSDTNYLQPLSLTLAQEIHARFVVIGDAAGLRLAHPNTAKLGASMMDDDNDEISPTLSQGRAVISKAEGSLGWSMRARAPVFDPLGEKIIGLVSVGYLLDSIETVIDSYRATLLWVILAAFFISLLTALWFANHFKKAIFGLEPEQIGQLYQERIATLESVREGIIAVNAEGQITTINKAAVQFLELEDQVQWQGQNISTVMPESPMLDNRSHSAEFEKEVWFKQKPYIVNRLPLRNESVIIGLVASFRPKDELDLVSQQLSRVQQYADSLRSQAHEYTNKLHTIAGLIQIGASDQALALIGQENQAHRALIKLLMSTVSDAILAGCLLGKFNRAKEIGLTLNIDPDSHMNDLPAHLPRDQLASMIGNIIDNAFDACLAEGAHGTQINLTMTDFGTDILFEVEDQGAGVDPSQRELIFTKGYSSKSGGDHGIGLHLVQKLARRFGGYVTMEPVTLGGSRFTISLPKQTPRL
ncbi:MAG: sensor histidine kinase [Oceanospirillaceae bacterium]|nr:sensor histidine kinase [Oceanospirillaceae bacterium]MBT4441801.1 sensor histidine kinase [Oceanospirillaceae bacterium]MBT6077870.1 sensor histidine kinase [Oceanospirillaceae bacterium]